MGWRRCVGLPAAPMGSEVRTIFVILIALAVLAGLLGAVLA